MNRITVSSILILVTRVVSAAELYESFPQEIYPSEKYVFYSHGLIVEGTDQRPVHDDFGAYEFNLIRQALLDGASFNLISHHRPEGTDPQEYAINLVAWVSQLISAGVAPEDITLVGFSRGAQITLMASNALSMSGINTAMMGVCLEGDYPLDPPLQLGGDVLSIYETSDIVNSCVDLLERSSEARSTREIAISTGLKHGAFFKPLPEWVEPLKDWLNTNR